MQRADGKETFASHSQPRYIGQGASFLGCHLAQITYSVLSIQLTICKYSNCHFGDHKNTVWPIWCLEIASHFGTLFCQEVRAGNSGKESNLNLLRSFKQSSRRLSWIVSPSHLSSSPAPLPQPCTSQSIFDPSRVELGLRVLVTFGHIMRCNRGQINDKIWWDVVALVIIGKSNTGEESSFVIFSLFVA